MDLSPRFRPVPRENVMSLLSYTESPSSQPGMAAPTKRGVAYANPTSSTAMLKSSVKEVLTDPVMPETRFSGLRHRNPNVESEPPEPKAEWGRSHIAHILPQQTRIEPKHQVRMMTPRGAHGEQMAAVFGLPLGQDAPDTTRKASIRCSTPRVLGSAWQPIMPNVPLVSHAETPRLERSPGHGPRPKEVSNNERIRRVVQQLVTQRKGGPAAFWVALTRGSLVPDQAGITPGEVNLLSCQKQLSAVAGEEISFATLRELLWGDAEDAEVRTRVTYVDFTRAFVPSEPQPRPFGRNSYY